MSGKTKVLFNFLCDWAKQNKKRGKKEEAKLATSCEIASGSLKANKVLIFSQTKKMLNIIEALAR